MSINYLSFFQQLELRNTTKFYRQINTSKCSRDDNKESTRISERKYQEDIDINYKNL